MLKSLLYKAFKGWALICSSQGWGVAVLVGVPNKDDAFKTHPVNFLNERTLKGTFYGNYKPRTDLPSVVEKYMNGVSFNIDWIVHSIRTFIHIYWCFFFFLFFVLILYAIILFIWISLLEAFCIRCGFESDRFEQLTSSLFLLSQGIRDFSIHITLDFPTHIFLSQICPQKCWILDQFLKWSDFPHFIMQTLVFTCWLTRYWNIGK